MADYNAAPLRPDAALIKRALACKCPKCGKGDIFMPGFSMTVCAQCSQCGLKLSEHDSGDGPAVFLIFFLGFLLVPSALLFEYLFAPPLWVHGVLWGSMVLIITLGALRYLKACIIALQFKHRPGDWAQTPEEDQE